LVIDGVRKNWASLVKTNEAEGRGEEVMRRKSSCVPNEIQILYYAFE